MKNQFRSIMILGALLASNAQQEISRSTSSNKSKINDTPVVPKGLKEWHYGKNCVLAINRKNADRKARQKGYIQ